MLDPERIRLNPVYRLLPFDELDDTQRASLRELGTDRMNEVAGVLVAPAWSGLPDKVADAAAGRVLEMIRDRGGAGIERQQVLRLLYEAIVVADLDGGTVSGPAAFGPVEGDSWWPEPAGRLADLSHAAVAAIARLDLTNVESVTSRLYWYGRVPLSPRWSRQMRDAEAVLEMMRPALEPSWVQTMPTEDAGGWLVFAPRNDVQVLRSVDFPYKLYVSALPSELARALPLAVEAITTAGASRFKVGADANGLLRPDKMVVYLRDVDELQAVAAATASALSGCLAHGVPFTAAIADDGLLSWGGDPVLADAPLGRGRESWRLSICRRLAEDLVAARLAHLAPGDATRYALRRLSLDGVDASTFAPHGLLAPGPNFVAASKADAA